MDRSDRPPLSMAAVRTSEDTGRLMRVHRRAKGLSLERVAGLSNVGVRFLSEVERGKPTSASCGRVACRRAREDAPRVGRACRSPISSTVQIRRFVRRSLLRLQIDTVLRTEDSRREIAEPLGRADRLLENATRLLLHRDAVPGRANA